MRRHASVEERVARGRAARKDVPRRSHADFRPAPRRKTCVDILRAQAKTRLAELIPIRHARMLASPFAFYRGGAAIMAADLANTPRSGITAQLCGDAHLTNFGVFAAPDRRLVFGLNDFDESLPGPWEWDVKRLAASFEVAMRERAFSRDARRDVVLTVVDAYQRAMLEFAEKGNLDVWYARLDAEQLLATLTGHASGSATARVARALSKAQSKTSMLAFEKLTVQVGNERRFASHPPLLVPIAELVKGAAFERLQASLTKLISEYRATLPSDRKCLLEQYRLVDLARKVVGVGSVGTRAFVGLLLGRDDEDPLLLQFKEAEASVLERYLSKSRYSNHGQRVVEGQRLMQAASDILLGWVRVRGIDNRSHDYYVRQLWDGKGSVDPETARPALFAPYARACGWTLARAHARCGDRVAIASYLGKSDAFARAIAAFANAYADQNERDYKLFRSAIKRGELRAETDS